MKILTSGCSFTSDQYAWPDRLKELGHTINNLGLAAAGNRYISESIISELILNKKQYDYVLVMWSGLIRLDFLVDADIIAMYPNHLFRTKKITDNFGFVTSGATPDNSHPASIRIKKETELITNYESRAYQSLLEIIKLQSFLKCNNVSYKFMSYVNYWNNEDSIINFNFGIKQFKSLSTLVDNIDFSKFIFYNDNKDGIYEMSKLKLLSPDKFHPSKDGHIVWGNFVNDKILEGK